jgi:hypothetical protein
MKMDSGMIGKIQKAKRYAQERERFHIEALTVTMEGANNSHRISYAGGKWNCDCDYFHSHRVCPHTMALEEILKGMLPIPVET